MLFTDSTDTPEMCVIDATIDVGEALPTLTDTTYTFFKKCKGHHNNYHYSH